jgi:alpha-tubulin suppressor-like RCC1 family protein
MSTVNISNLKYTWKGPWTTQTTYVKNDVVQYDNASYVCLKDIPREYEIGMDTGVSTNFYRVDSPKIYLRDRLPTTDTEYWKLIARGVNFKRGWMPHRVYKPGDLVRVGGDLYICKVGGVRNTWVEDTVYWTKVFENVNPSLKRNYMVSYCNTAPLGWTRNNGDHPTTQTSDGWTWAAIDALGNVCSMGGWGSSTTYSTAARGHQGSLVHSWVTGGFSFVDWIRSTDVRNGIGVTLSNIGLPTPDGKTPRCIQWVKNWYQALYLFNNGEVYASGFQSVGELGDNATSTNRGYAVRCTNQSTSGWLGDSLSKSFNQTKIIKVDISNNGLRSTSGSTSCFALGDDGSLWSWGYNAFGQLGHGASTTVATDQFSNKSVPTRIPASFFDNKKILDFMLIGNQYTSVIAQDEDGDLWGWGSNYSGELGMGDFGSSGGNNVHAIPTRIPYDFKKHGGIKKFSYYHGGTTGSRAAYILCNDGSLLMAGTAQQGINPTLHLYGGNAVTRQINRFVKFTNTGPGQLEIDNFWVVGDIGHNIYAREKNSGRTFAIGDNAYNQLGQHSLSTYWYNSGGQSGGWALVEAVFNVCHVTNTMYEMATSGTQVYPTYVLVTDEGRAWAIGRNTYGSAGLGYSGQTGQAGYEQAAQNPETGGYFNLFQPVKLPNNTRIASAMGMGAAGADMCFWISDSGQGLITGCDDGGDRRGGVYAYSIQGSPINRGMGFVTDRYTMHCVAGD